MPQDIILPTPTQELSWTDLRRGLRNCIKAVAPLARVYSRWPLKFDIGKTTELLTSNSDDGRIHAWIIAVSRATSYNNKVGGSNLEWDLTVRIWGFLGYEYGADDSNTQNVLEEECRKITQVIYLNRLGLGLDNTQALKDVGYLRFTDIDTHGFGDTDVIIAQGELEMTLSEYL